MAFTTRSRPEPSRRAAMLAAAILAVASGCDPGRTFEGSSVGSSTLLIASDWPESERRKIGRDFAEWLNARAPEGAAKSTSIAWTSRSDRVGSPDVLLGGALASFADLASRDQLERLGTDPDQRAWILARRSVVGLVGGAESPGRRIALDDPRAAPTTRAWALERLRGEGWPSAYSRLLVLYGIAVPVGWREGSAQAAVDRGDADVALMRIPDASRAVPNAVVIEEGAAIRRGSRQASSSARAFLQFLSETVESGPEASGPMSLAAEGMAADLLGSTLVDAQDELRRAVASVREADLSPESVAILAEAPPWPPASVAKLLARGGEGAAALVETLAEQLAPEAGSRVWLSQSWLRPRRPIDGALLREIAGVEQGRLAREPRFRAWLRAEWTQWARQRYRWVARLAAARSPLLTSSASGEP